MADRIALIRIVLVDDSVDLRYMMAMFMEFDDRFQVVGQAGDGVDALELLDRLERIVDTGVDA